MYSGQTLPKNYMETFCLSTVQSHDLTLPWRQANNIKDNKLQSGTDNIRYCVVKGFNKKFKTRLACDEIIGVTILLLVNEYALNLHCNKYSIVNKTFECCNLVLSCRCTTDLDCLSWCDFQTFLIRNSGVLMHNSWKTSEQYTGKRIL